MPALRPQQNIAPRIQDRRRSLAALVAVNEKLTRLERLYAPNPSRPRLVVALVVAWGVPLMLLLLVLAYVGVMVAWAFTGGID